MSAARVSLAAVAPAPAVSAVETEVPVDASEGRDTNDATVRVVLIDDRVAVRRALRLLLDGAEGVMVVGEAGEDSVAALHAYSHTATVIVLDLQLAGGPSIELIRGLRERAPETEIVVLCAESNPVFARQALDAGARGFVLRDQADRELREAVRRAAGGREFVSSPVAVGLAAVRSAAGEDGLSPREIEVLRLTALGYTGSEIAQQLHLSRRTVESHRATIHRKLGLATRAQLVRYALGRQLIATC